MRVNEAVLGQLYSVSPYENFSLEGYPRKLDGWHGERAVFRHLIDSVRPALIVEVGSWLGASALRMGAIVRELELACPILCVDTWLGSLEFWTDRTDPERYKALGLRHGYPSVYYQFLANVLHAQLDDIIVPFPQTSTTAASWIRAVKLQPDLVYIDASHEASDVYSDLTHYWEVLSGKGVMFGDDYDDYWPGVVEAVNRFAVEHDLTLEIDDVFWILRKRPPREPAAGRPSLRNELIALRSENAICRSRLISAQANTERLVAEKHRLWEESRRSETRAGFFYERERDAERRVAELQQAIQERDEALDQKDAALALKDTMLATAERRWEEEARRRSATLLARVKRLARNLFHRTP